MTPIPVLPTSTNRVWTDPSETDTKLRAAALQLEATFLSEMLKSAGFGESRESFGGGVGEDQFGSFIRDAQAMKMAESGGIGLAEALFEALKGRVDE